MNILRGIASIALVLLVAACGASVEVPEIVTETAGLEVQVVTSMSDSTPIDFFEILEGENVVFHETNVLNRVQRFSLEVGHTYILKAQGQIGDGYLEQNGTVLVAREVTLVSSEQRVELNLTQRVRTELIVMINRFGVRVRFTPEFTEGGVTARLAEGSFEEWEPFVIESSDDLMPIGASSRVETDQFGRTRVQYGLTDLPNGFAQGSYVGDVLLQSSGYCGRYLGFLSFTWESEHSRIVQTINPYLPCKG